ncbi:hypothetical protein EON66_12080 [archaeon]|nr:MAG: hypothetical protein EON66_12080 [archaeon]
MPASQRSPTNALAVSTLHQLLLPLLPLLPLLMQRTSHTFRSYGSMHFFLLPHRWSDAVSWVRWPTLPTYCSSIAGHSAPPWSKQVCTCERATAPHRASGGAHPTRTALMHAVPQHAANGASRDAEHALMSGMLPAAPEVLRLEDLVAKNLGTAQLAVLRDTALSESLAQYVQGEASALRASVDKAVRMCEAVAVHNNAISRDALLALLAQKVRIRAALEASFCGKCGNDVCARACVCMCMCVRA